MEVGIRGIEFGHPEHEYSTRHMFDVLGDKLSDKVKDNILQLGVENRYFARPLEGYLQGAHPSFQDGSEPISDLAADVAKRCLANLGVGPDDITCLVAASENSDYLSPGLSSILVRKIGLSNFTPHFNLQGMACSTFPKTLELGKSLARDKDRVLVVISGCNSGWYLPHLNDGAAVMNPGEIGDLPDREKRVKKWVSTMFSFLFGDGAVAFVLSREADASIRVGRVAHAVNFDRRDYRKACVQLRPNPANQAYEYELTAGHKVIDLALDYSKRVMMRFLGGDAGSFDEKRAREYAGGLDKLMIHTGSMKILDGFRDVYGLRGGQIRESYDVLRDYGNLTGCSIPAVMRRAFVGNGGARKGALIGITMGFGLDVVEVEKAA